MVVVDTPAPAVGEGSHDAGVAADGDDDLVEGTEMLVVVGGYMEHC